MRCSERRTPHYIISFSVVSSAHHSNECALHSASIFIPPPHSSSFHCHSAAPAPHSQHILINARRTQRNWKLRTGKALVWRAASFKREREREFVKLIFSTHPASGLKILFSSVLLRGMNWCYCQASASHCQITQAKTFYGSGSKRCWNALLTYWKGSALMCPRDTWRSSIRKEVTLNKTIDGISKLSVAFKYVQNKTQNAFRANIVASVANSMRQSKNLLTIESQSDWLNAIWKQHRSL